MVFSNAFPLQVIPQVSITERKDIHNVKVSLKCMPSLSILDMFGCAR